MLLDSCTYNLHGFVRYAAEWEPPRGAPVGVISCSPLHISQVPDSIACSIRCKAFVWRLLWVICH